MVGRPGKTIGELLLILLRTTQGRQRRGPQAAILYDKFHVLTHLGEVMDKVRRQEYARLSGEGRRFIKGQRYTLLLHWENLSLEGKEALRLLFNANRRLNKAYLLKESFGQLWDYGTRAGRGASSTTGGRPGAGSASRRSRSSTAW
jgi:transposase